MTNIPEPNIRQGNLTIKTLATTILVEDLQNKIKNINVGDCEPESSLAGQGKILMLVGATGTGKSTLINAFVNYIMGVRYEDGYRYKLIENEGQRSQAISETKWITSYIFNQKEYPKLPYTFTIIDTPGYGDTDGIERDNQITSQISEFFSMKGEQGIDHLDGIGFVIQASQARLTPTQRYIFEFVLSIFGKDIYKNIFLMVTFSDGSVPIVLESIKAARFGYQESFQFNNAALFPGPADNYVLNQIFWEIGEECFKNFFQSFYETSRVNLHLARENLRQRDELQCVLQGLQPQINIGLLILEQFQQEEKAMKDHDEDLSNNKDFTYEVEVTKRYKIDLPPGRYATNCQKCHNTCHKMCKVPCDIRKAECAAMNDQGYCQVCPGRCYWQHHENQPYYLQVYTKKEKRTSQVLRERYEQAKVKKSKKEQIMDGLKKDLKTIYDGVFVMISRAKSILQRLSEIALRPNPLTELDYIDILIETEKRELKEGWARRVKAFKQIRDHIEGNPEFQQVCGEETYMRFWKIIQRQINNE